MKKILLGTSAIVALGLFAGPAAAQVTLKISGDVEFVAGWADLDDFEGDDRDYDFQVDSNLIFSATGQADNGLTYGAVIDLENLVADADVDADEAYVTVGGNWGVVTLGDDDGAADQLFVTVPTAGTGITDGEWTDFDGPGDPFGDFAFKPNDTGDSTKIKYLSPVFGGFTAGVSFTPDTGSEGQEVDFDTAGEDEVFEIGARWAGTFGAFSTTIGGGYTNDVGVGDEDAWGVGATVGFGAFSLGTNYIDNGEDFEAVNVGATYSMGAWNFGVAANWTGGDFVDAVEDVDFEGDNFAWGLGADYTVAPGLTIAGDVVFGDAEFGADEDGTIIVVETKVAF